MKFNLLHHIAIICRDEKLGFELLKRHITKKDVLLKLKKDNLILELFIKPNASKRVSGLPVGEACGLRHLAFKVDDINKAVTYLEDLGIVCEKIRFDEFDKRKMTLLKDPDSLSIELHE